jgi:hypothetical protein
MKYAAESEEYRIEAEIAGSDRDIEHHQKGVNISGVYHIRSDTMLDQKTWDDFLQACKCPWVFRKLIVKASANIQDVFVSQDDEKMVFKYKMNLFGSREVVYLLDGKQREIENPWKKVNVTFIFY